ncbi:MAG: DUF4476 domain-containing protein [Chitinophagaceae bacterium]
MKHLLVRISFLLLISSQAFGQQTHFIYLQTESRDPFYVLLNKKNFSSSSIGYLIIPKLPNGEYNVRLGFAKNAGAEQDYILQVKDNEQGYLVKEFGEKGWALFNLQSLELQYAGAINKDRNNVAALQQAEANEKEKADASLAAVETKRKLDEQTLAVAKEKADAMAMEAKRKADETAAATAKDNTNAAAVEAKRKADEMLAAEEKKKVDEIALAAEKMKTSALALETKKKAEQLTSDVAAEKVRNEAEEAKLVIEKPLVSEPVPVTNIKAIGSLDSRAPRLVNQVRTDSGIIYKYAVTNADGQDTVNAYIKGAMQMVAIIPAEKKEPEPNEMTGRDADSVTKKDPVKFLNMDFKQDSTKADAGLIEPIFNKTNTPPVKENIENKKPDTLTANLEKTLTSIPKWDSHVRMDTIAKQGATATISNINCKAQADDKDFFNLRKKMAAEEGADEMVMLARKTMKEKCFTTLQVRNLSVLFLNDADRYQFLDAAYPFTSDASQFVTLNDLLFDPYYVQRFKAMIRK